MMEGPYSEDIRKLEESTVVNHSKSDGGTDVISENDRTPNSGLTDFLQTNNSTRHTELVKPDFQPKTQRGRWLVLIACCLSSFVTMGMVFSLGTVHLDIMDTFDTPRPLAALVQSLCVGVGFGTGILTGPLLGRLGGAITLMHGGLTCCVDLIGACLAPNIYILIACVGGLGASSCYLAAQVVMGSTFRKRRNLAVSMITMFTGVGMTIYPSLMHWMVDEYTLRGMFLILGGICFHCVLFGMIVRTFGTSPGPSVKSFEMKESEEEAEDYNTMTTRQINTRNHDTSTSSSERMDRKENQSRTFGDQNPYTHEGRNLQRQSDQDISAEDTNQNTASKNSEIDLTQVTKTRHADEITVSVVANSKTGKEDGNTNGTSTSLITDENADGKLHVKERSQTTGQRLQKPRLSVVTISDHVDVLGSANTELSRTQLDIKQEMRRTSGQRRRLSVSETFQTDLFHNTRYLIVSIVCWSVYLTFNAPTLFITDIAKGAGLSVEQGAQLLSVLAISNTVARGATGLLQVLCRISALSLLGVVLGCCGVAAFGFAILDYVDYGDVFASHVSACVVYGLFFGIAVTSGSLSCLELVDLHQYAPALGYQFFIGGTCASIGGPLGGWIKDSTGGYSPIFCIAMAQGLLAMTTVFTIRYCDHKTRAKRQNYDINTNNDNENDTYSHFNNAYSSDNVGVDSTEPETILTYL